jgi:hypothetical protein
LQYFLARPFSAWAELSAGSTPEDRRRPRFDEPASRPVRPAGLAFEVNGDAFSPFGGPFRLKPPRPAAGFFALETGRALWPSGESLAKARPSLRQYSQQFILKVIARP